MNIQIFGRKKCFDTKKAERYFKERGVKFQSIDIQEKGLSKGEYNSIKQAVGGMESMLNKNAKGFDIAQITYLADEKDREEKLLMNPSAFATPIVRNGKQATIGYQQEVWKTWK